MFQNSNYSSIHLSDVLNQYYVPEKIDKPELESYITLSSYGKGIKKREIKEGKTPVPFTGCRIKTGQFVSSRLHAKEGAFGLVPDKLDGFVVSRDFPVFDIDTKRINPKYLLAAVSHESFYQQFLNDSFGSTTKRRIKEDIFLEYSIILPPLNKQNEYVSFLEHIERTQTMFKKYLNLLDSLVKSRFIEMFENNIDSKNWSIYTVAQVCEVVTDGSHFSPEDVKEGYPMLSVKDMRTYGFDYSDCKHISQTDYDFLVKNGCRPLLGDVLIAKDGSFFKKGFVIKEEMDQAILSSIAIMRPKKNLMNPNYLVKFLLSDKVLATVSSMTSGTALKRVILKKFKSMKIVVPPIELQNQFVLFVEQVDKSKFEVIHSLERLLERFKTSE